MPTPEGRKHICIALLEERIPRIIRRKIKVEEIKSGVEISLLRVTVRLVRSEIPFMINALVETRFSSEDSTGATGSVPGRSSEDAPKTGSIEEQNALQFPFRIVQLSEYTRSGPKTQSGRHSALDIGQ